MSPGDIKEQRILISVLNWGFGHVSRCIGLIQELQKESNTIYIACNEEQETIFKAYFRDVEFVKHNGYPFVFGGKGNFAADLVKSSQGLAKRLKKEQLEVKELVDELNISLVLSDHRYGFRSGNVKSIFITHQLNLPVKWFQIAIQRWHKKLVNNFDEIWVMDYADSRLAGKLSRSGKFHNLNYIGPYSRFMGRIIKEPISSESLLIASGPSVYAQQFINKYAYKSKLVVCAEQLDIPLETTRVTGDWLAMDDVIVNATHITTRSGYSSILDKQFLKSEFELIPTKGQAEQEYLAKLHS
jgi:hypothetical protein